MPVNLHYASRTLLAVLTLSPRTQRTGFLPVAHHISANVPVLSSPVQSIQSRVVAETGPRCERLCHCSRALRGTTGSWQATLPGTIIHSMTFASPSIGYAVAEGGPGFGKQPTAARPGVNIHISATLTTFYRCPASTADDTRGLRLLRFLKLFTA